MFVLRRSEDGNHWLATCERCGKEFCDELRGVKRLHKYELTSPFTFLKDLQTHWETRNTGNAECKVVS